VIIDESDRHLEIAVADHKEDVRNHKSVQPIKFVLQGGTISEFCTLHSLAQR